MPVMSMNSFLVYSFCGQPQNHSDSLQDAKGKYIWIWLAEGIFSISADVHGDFYSYF